MFETYPKTVKLAIKNFPLRNHKFAWQAAVAALAANRQGKFWEFHDELYKNYNRLNEEKIRDIAQQLGLDMAKLDQDMKDPELGALVRNDLMAASGFQSSTWSIRGSIKDLCHRDRSEKGPHPR